MSPGTGRAVLVVSALGYPLTQLAIRRFGRRGALVVEVACAGLLARDAAMIAGGAPRRLRPVPAGLLWLEAAAAAASVVTGLRPALAKEPWEGASRQPTQRELLRRGAVRLLFGLHTLRFWIYLRPDKGRR